MSSAKSSRKSRAVYRAERDDLVERLRQFLDNDERVAAAWLWGSLGKGTSDDFSDLDIWIVVRDDALPAVRHKRRDFAAQIGDTLLFAEAMQNAPCGGAYLMAAYAGQQGPQLADWYWQPQRQSPGIPSDALVLTNRASLPTTGESTRISPATPEDIEAAYPPRSSEQKHKDEEYNSISVFWAMLLISAKYILRQREDEPLFLEEMLQNLNRGAHRFAGIPIQGTDTVTPTAPAAKIALLHHFTNAMEAVMCRLETKDAAALPLAMPDAVRRYLVMVEVIHSEM